MAAPKEAWAPQQYALGAGCSDSEEFPLWGRRCACFQLYVGQLCTPLKMLSLRHTAWGLYPIRSPFFHWNLVWTQETQRGAVQHPLPVNCVLIECILLLAFGKLQLLSLFTPVPALLIALHWFQQTHLSFPKTASIFLTYASSCDPGLYSSKTTNINNGFLFAKWNSLFSPLLLGHSLNSDKLRTAFFLKPSQNHLLPPARNVTTPSHWVLTPPFHPAS